MPQLHLHMCSGALSVLTDMSLPKPVGALQYRNPYIYITYSKLLHHPRLCEKHTSEKSPEKIYKNLVFYFQKVGDCLSNRKVTCSRNNTLQVCERSSDSIVNGFQTCLELIPCICLSSFSDLMT